MEKTLLNSLDAYFPMFVVIFFIVWGIILIVALKQKKVKPMTSEDFRKISDSFPNSHNNDPAYSSFPSNIFHRDK